MSDERDSAGSEGTEATGTEDAAGQTAVVTRPLRPTGKRTRRAAVAPVEDDEVSDTDTESADGTEGAEPTAKSTKTKAAKPAKKKSDAKRVNPFAFVWNYLKQVVAELRKANAEVDDPLRAGPREDLEDQYLVWSNEHRRWWAPGHVGYVQRVGEAGRYTRDQALAICRNALGTAGGMGIFAELPVRLRDVEDFVRGQMIPGRLM